MEKLLNEFTVHRPIDQTWAVLTDLERIAPCMPGAQLQEIEGPVYRGVVKVKLGSIVTNFKGQAQFESRDDQRHAATLKAEGRDTGGKGSANALITATLTPITATTTTCAVETDLHISGKVAQFGRGIMADVSKKLMDQFASNLNEMLDASGTAAEPDAAPAAPEARVAPATDEPQVRTVDGPAAEPIDMSQVAGSAVLKRLLPAVGGLVVLLLALRRLRRRS